MCRWLAYAGSDVYLERLIFEPANSLASQSLAAQHSNWPTNGDGFGVGWYGSREEPGLFRDVLPAWNDSNLRNVSAQIQSRLFFAHVRASTGASTSRTNCHPFRYGKWLFMHNGQPKEKATFKEGKKHGHYEMYESPRVLRRLQPLREWSHEQVKQVFT